MSWPTPQDYAEAVQNPRTSFRDPELRRAVPELTHLGLPRPITGNFASVYKLTNGQKAVAVRCFFREFSDMRDRYEAISAMLQVARLPYSVGFSYMHDGISVKRAGYPVLKMDWAEGELLDVYIRDHLHDAKALTALAAAWKLLTRDLAAAGIAHGDLQHGNVLCLNGRLRLVDYDGMFVPALRGQQSHELGHPNYQHPERQARHFGTYLDRFSAWVIYTSILALASDPGLWQALGAGDERLLFGQDDFRSPGSSTVFQALSAHADPTVRSASAQLRKALDLDVERVPPLDSPLPAVRKRRARLSSRSSEVVPFSSQALPEWVRQSLPQPGSVEFLEPGSIPRVVLAVAGVGLILDLIPTHFLATGTRAEVAVAVLGAASFTGVFAFIRDPSVRVRMRLQVTRARHVFRLRSLESRAASIAARKARLDAERYGALANVGQNRQRQSARRSARSDEVENGLRQNLGLAGQLLKNLQSARDARLDQELRNYRNSRMDRELRSRHLMPARIRGIGRRDKLHLWMHGVRSAADIAPKKANVLNQVSPRTAAALLQWRESARPACPRELPQDRREHISRGYDREIAKIERLRKQILLSAAPILGQLKQLGAADGQFFDSTEVRVHERFDSLETAQSREERLLTRLLADQNGDLDAIEEELHKYQGLTFPRFLARLVLGHRSSRMSLLQLLW